jgi:hypothetical protein
MPLYTVVEEFLVWEGELTQREEALAMREDETRISEQALVQASTVLDEERAKDNPTRQEYLNKIEAHTTGGKHVLDLDRVLAEKKVELDVGERGLELLMVAPVEAQARWLKPWDNHDELMEFVELRQLLWDVEADHVVESSQVAALVRDVSHVSENLGMPPISGIPQDLHTIGDVLGSINMILEGVKEAYDSATAPGNSHYCHRQCLSVITFCFTYFILGYYIFRTWCISHLPLWACRRHFLPP